MADLSITAANVVSYGVKRSCTAGGTITAGLAVREDADGDYIAATDTSAANAAVAGIALNGASDGQPLMIHTGGPIDLGATLAVGKTYVLSASGAIAPIDDIAGSEYVTVLGVATATDRLLFQPIVSGVAAAGAVT